MGVVVVVLVVWVAAGPGTPKPSVSTSQSFTGVSPSPVAPSSPATAPLPQNTAQAPVARETPPPARQSSPSDSLRDSKRAGALEALAGGPAVPQSAAAATVTYTDSGFSPASVTIRNGGTVTFQNNSSRAFRPASDPHPAHNGYPEPGTCNGHAFDPCGAVPVGALWSFTFHTSGTWGYHDHLNPSKEGMVVVK